MKWNIENLDLNWIICIDLQIVYQFNELFTILKEKENVVNFCFN